MNILIIDQTSEEQAKIAKMIESFDLTDREALDIQVSLASSENYTSKLAQSEIVIIGPGLGESATAIARHAKEISHACEVIMFVSEQWYSAELFRHAHIAKVRKVLPSNASTLDLLQELVAVQEQFRNAGRTKKGKLVVFAQAKGGVGATSLIAALAEAANDARMHTMIWDFDIESKDLSCGLNAQGAQSQIVSSWLHASNTLTRESLKEALIPIGSFVSLLPPPHDIAAGMDLIGHPDSIKLIHRVVELAKVTQDAILVDTAGKLSPATGTLLRMADEVVVLTDDSLLGLSAAQNFLDTLMPIVRNNNKALRMLCVGGRLSKAQIAQMLSEGRTFDPRMWALPEMPVDSAAEKWPGTGSTLYSLGTKNTKRTIDALARELFVGFGDETKIKVMPMSAKHNGPAKWMRMVLQKTSNA